MRETAAAGACPVDDEATPEFHSWECMDAYMLPCRCGRWDNPRPGREPAEPAPRRPVGQSCAMELCEFWTGDGCACAVFDIERPDRWGATTTRGSDHDDE